MLRQEVLFKLWKPIFQNLALFIWTNSIRGRKQISLPVKDYDEKHVPWRTESVCFSVSLLTMFYQLQDSLSEFNVHTLDCKYFRTQKSFDIYSYSHWNCRNAKSWQLAKCSCNTCDHLQLYHMPLVLVLELLF